MTIVRSSVAAALLLALSACTRPAETKPADAAPERVVVTLAPLVSNDTERRVAVVGTIYGDEETTVSAKVAGRVQHIFKDMGDRCKGGEPLAQIEPTDYELERVKQEMAVKETLAKLGLTSEPEESFDPSALPTVKRAVLQAKNAEAKLGRARQLFEQKPPRISAQDFADLETAWQVAQSNSDVEVLTARSLLAEARSRRSSLELAAQRLKDTTINSPELTDGGHSYAVTTRMVSVGEYLREGTAMFRLVDDRQVKYRASVPERYISELSVGQGVSVSVEAYEDEFHGTVVRIRPQVDPASRTFEIEVLIPNESGKLTPGAFARGSVLIGVDRSVTFAPEEAVVSFAGAKKVFSVQDGKAVEWSVTTGRRRPDQVEIVGGLPGVSEVVVTGMTRLAQGTPVEVKTAADLSGGEAAAGTPPPGAR
jgi:membrane fusion protein, multidrug efflux system